MEQLLKFIAPRAGCVLTVGFSGLWDQSLVRFLASVCGDLDKERTWRKRLKDSKDGDKSEDALQSSSFWINIDPENRPPLLQELASFGISPIHLEMKAEAFAQKAPEFKQAEIKETKMFLGDGGPS